MTEKCKKSLSRIFKLCDLDNDGCLSDAELSLFQRRCSSLALEVRHLRESSMTNHVCFRCFHMDLESGTLESLKAVVQKSCPEGITQQGLNNRGS